MPSYVVTGASRGLGFQFVKTLASDLSNTVFGLARNPALLESKLQDAGITNVHVIEGDVSDAASMKHAALAVSKVTSGTIDVVINNAALVESGSAFLTLDDFASNPAALTAEFTACFNANVLGVVNVVSAFLPLLQAGSVKKFLNLSTSLADLAVTNDVGIAYGTPYVSSKAAANVVVAKYNAVYGAARGQEAILFLSISPGFVWTEQNITAAEGNSEKAAQMGGIFAKYAPDFERPATPEESVRDVLKVLGEKSVEKGDGGKFVSHLGDGRWL